VNLLLSQIESGLALGSAYGLLAIGLTIVWSATGIPDFAQGQYLMLALMTGVVLGTGRYGVIVGILAAIAAGVASSAVIEGTIYGPLRRLGVRNFMLGLAVFYILENLGQLLYGVQTQPFFITIYSSLPLFLIPFITGVGLYAAAELVMHRTRFGLILRAIAVDSRTALLMGIKTQRVIYGAVLCAGALAGVSGLLVGLTQHAADIYVGQSIVLTAFTAAILGGIGSVTGAFLGGLVLGVIQTTSALVVNSNLLDMFTFAVLILVLIFRPRGLLGGRA